jgi:hypothetical protein
LNVPEDSYNGYYAPAYTLGARVQSNSWTGDPEPYEIYCNNVDQFTYDHRDFLVVFAVGNTGPYTFSASIPSTAKNVLAVGSVQSSASSWDYISLAQNAIITVDGSNASYVVREIIMLIQFQNICDPWTFQSFDVW